MAVLTVVIIDGAVAGVTAYSRLVNTGFLLLNREGLIANVTERLNSFFFSWNYRDFSLTRINVYRALPVN